MFDILPYIHHMMYITRFSENVLNGLYASPDVYTPILSKVHISEKRNRQFCPKWHFWKNEITKLCRKVPKWRFRGYESQGNYMYQKPRILDLSDDGLTRFHYSDNGTQEYSQTFLKFMFISFLGNFIWILYGFHFFPKVLLDVVLCIFWDVLSEICFEQTAPYYLWSWWIFITLIFCCCLVSYIKFIGRCLVYFLRCIFEIFFEQTSPYYLWSRWIFIKMIFYCCLVSYIKYYYKLYCKFYLTFLSLQNCLGSSIICFIRIFIQRFNGRFCVGFLRICVE